MNSALCLRLNSHLINTVAAQRRFFCEPLLIEHIVFAFDRFSHLLHRLSEQLPALSIIDGSAELSLLAIQLIIIRSVILLLLASLSNFVGHAG